MCIMPATREAESGELLEPRRPRRLWWAKIVPLHSSLGSKSETPSQKTSKQASKQTAAGRESVMKAIKTSMIDCVKKMWHTWNTMQPLKKTWVHDLCRDMDEAGNHHCQQTQQKTKHCTFLLISESWTMRTHGHREGNITHWGLSGGEALEEG